MGKASIKRKINQSFAQKYRKKAATVPSIQKSSKSFPITDEDGFTIVLTKKEKKLLRDEQCDEPMSTLEAQPSDIPENGLPDCPNGSDDEMDTRSVVSKSWVRKQLKGPHRGGISRPSCKKKQATMLRRVILHTHLHLKHEAAKSDTTADSNVSNFLAQLSSNSMTTTNKLPKHLNKSKSSKPTRKQPTPSVIPFKSRALATHNTINSLRNCLPPF